nr:huntingtin-associated protein 1-like [Nicotiana tomentosiformis]
MHRQVVPKPIDHMLPLPKDNDRVVECIQIESEIEPEEDLEEEPEFNDDEEEFEEDLEEESEEEEEMGNDSGDDNPTEHALVIADSSGRSGEKNDTRNDEHVARMAQEMESLREEVQHIRELAHLAKKQLESFQEYARRWRLEATRAQPPFDDSKLTKYFIRAQEGIYFEKMMGMMGQKFPELVKMGDFLEEGIQSGKLQSMAALQEASKAIQSGSLDGGKKKKEELKPTVKVQTYQQQSTTVIRNENDQEYKIVP